MVFDKNDIQSNKLIPHNAALVITKWIGSPSSLIIHTLLFTAAAMVLALKFFSFETVMLVWNTMVSLEAIYLSIFIQMTVNIQATQLSEIAEDVAEVQDEVNELAEAAD